MEKPLEDLFATIREIGIGPDHLIDRLYDEVDALCEENQNQFKKIGDLEDDLWASDDPPSTLEKFLNMSEVEQTEFLEEITDHDTTSRVVKEFVYSHFQEDMFQEGYQYLVISQQPNGMFPIYCDRLEEEINRLGVEEALSILTSGVTKEEYEDLKGELEDKEAQVNDLQEMVDNLEEQLTEYTDD